MFDIWDRYLKQIENSASSRWVGWNVYFPRKTEGLGSKLDEATHRGKYLRLKLYPTKLVKEKLVTKMVELGENFNSKLEKIRTDSRSGDFELNVAYAFDHWGLREIPADELHITPLESMKQKLYLEELDKNKKQEVTELIESWNEPFSLSQQISAILYKFSSENGIMPPKPPVLGGAYGGIP
jgi:hypothetical protein